MSQHDVAQFVTDHQLAIGYVASAIISTMPAQDCQFNLRTLYVWAFDALHLALNMKRPTKPAETPAKPNL